MAAKKGGKKAAGNMDDDYYDDDDYDEGEGEKGSKDKTKDKDGKPTASDQLKEKVLMNLWTVALVASGIVVLLGMGLLGLSITARTSAELYMQYIDGYDHGEFLVVIAVLGGVSAMVGVYGAAVCYLSTNPKKFKRIRYLVLAYVGWGVGLVLLLLVSFWLTFSALGSLDAVFKPGFTASLVKYVKEAKVKASIDALQRDLLCCGNYNHTEWFTVSWSDIVSKTESSVPESCCDKAAVQASHIQCVTSVPFGETIKLTVNMQGCVQALVIFYKSALNTRAAMMIGIAIVEGAVVVLVVLEVRKDSTGAKAAADEKNKLLTKADGDKKGGDAKGGDEGDDGYGAVPGKDGGDDGYY